MAQLKSTYINQYYVQKNIYNIMCVWFKYHSQIARIVKENSSTYY